jgi:hypothetical protein
MVFSTGYQPFPTGVGGYEGNLLGSHQRQSDLAENSITHGPILLFDASCPALVSLLEFLVAFEQPKISDNTNFKLRTSSRDATLQTYPEFTKVFSCFQVNFAG